MKFEIYTDESYITAERYRSIATFSYKADFKSEINEKIKRILTESKIAEFKWQNLKSAKYKFCAEKLIDFILNNINQYNIRVDIINWDTHDTRHKVCGRDDDANFERMFFHLLNTSLKKYPKNSSWNISPDQRQQIDWKTVNDCLKATGRHTEYHKTLFGNFFTDPYYHIDKFKEINSIETPCCQIADLFAGLSIFSIKCYSKYRTWQTQQTTPSLFQSSTEEVELSNSEQARFEIMKYFNKKCKQLKLGVS
ncbi:MAG: DUF3800 domain-containing protein, partial [Deltaproteobacteria bacterium]|nr:DUF3800 domain-containing protein [Deltaproteobacteria bacterium]